MPTIVQAPSIIKAAGKGEKIIEEYFGRINSNQPEISIARMNSPQGWEEPGQCPEFDEYTIVLKGTLQIKSQHELYLVVAGHGIRTKAGEWVQYSTPFSGGAEYIAICLPAYSNETVHRDNP
jgi:hypothetical protein